MEEVEFTSQDDLHESISETNQNFSKVARMVDENGAAVIRKNNAPWYVLIDYGKLRADMEADNETKG